MAAKPAVASERRRNRPDFILLGTVVALSVFGLVMIYSATRFDLERSAIPATFSMERQLIFVTIGLIGLALFSLIDYRDYRGLIPVIYVGTILLLVLVFLFDPVKGARRRWIALGFFNFQPAEFAKLTVILTTAFVLSSGPSGEVRWRSVLRSGALVALPTLLIVAEPDLGTAFVIPFVWLAMVFAAGLSWRRIATIVASGIGLSFHVFVNIGMTMGIAPVTGLPLPFPSQGGSFYLAMAMAAGMANSVWLRRSPVPDETFIV